MKINTITCHDVYNTGASLQAYALMNYLESIGHNVTIIDYKPYYLNHHYNLFSVANPKYRKNKLLSLLYIVAKMPNKIGSWKKKTLFDEFKKSYLKTTQNSYNSNEELKNDLPDADVYLVGSDQVWNTIFENGRDPAFYLDFVPENKIKASYAASFATDKVADEFSQVIQKRLERLDAISVRETSGLRILKGLGLKDAAQVMDPVFLKDKSFWRSMCLDLEKIEEFVFVYDFDDNPEVKEIALKIASEKKCKIYTVFKTDYSDKYLKNVGPLEFISYINNATYVISNSFHATAFSIIFEKDFVTLNRKEAINTRMKDLLSLFNLNERLIGSINDLSYVNKINYSTINSKIEMHVFHSKLYIDSVIKMVNR